MGLLVPLSFFSFEQMFPILTFLRIWYIQMEATCSVEKFKVLAEEE